MRWIDEMDWNTGSWMISSETRATTWFCVSVSDGDAHAWGVVHSESRLLPTEVLGSKFLLVLVQDFAP